MSSNTQAKPHVIVIGAGVVGASIAWHLTRQNAAVTIVASAVGGTATPNSFSWLNAGWHNPRFYYDFRRRSMAAWKRLAEAVPGLRDIVQWCGSLEWDLPPAELATYAREHGAWGYDIRRAERSEIRAREPWLASDALPDWGLRIGEEGAVEAAEAASLMVADAQAHGARLVSATVAGLVKDDGRVKGVALSTGEKLWADHIVLAAGVGSTQLCASVGITLPVTGSASLLVHSKPIARRLLNGLVISSGPHMRQTAKGRILAYSGFDDGHPGGNPQKTAEELFSRVKGMFNLEAGDADAFQLDFFTVGQRPMPRDRLPILGVSGLKGLTLAVMHSGVTLAAIVGEVLTDEIVNGRKDPALGDFGLGRFDSVAL